MPINGRSSLNTDPVRNFRFLAQFLPHTNGTNKQNGPTFKPIVGFTSISGLTITTESIPYREGGYNTAVHQVPGQSSFSPITFQRGVILGTPQHWNWMRQLFRVVDGAAVDNTFRCDILISVIQHPRPNSAATTIAPDVNNNYPNSSGSTVLDDMKNVAMQFKVYNAWPTAVSYSDLNAGDNAIMVEQLTVVHEGFTMSLADTWSDSAEAK